MTGGASAVQRRLADARGGRVVFLSHCLLNQNVRYPGGASYPGGVSEIVERYLSAGVGICQMPCPEQHAWGGVRKRLILPAFGCAGTARARAVRALLPAFTAYTRWRYARLARDVGRDLRSYRRAGMDVVAVVGVGGSPSCGVSRTLDLAGAVDVLTRCPVAELNRDTVNKRAIAANVTPGSGLFTQALRRRLRRHHDTTRFEEYDLLEELGLHPG